ncbi:hypothetical protein CAPTEDRAFT_208586 [Capitella teleta]|uniref:CxC1-like cysteine cluster associated with KDZ transposases domain-containing protein n=1 Tax=Capitella teleta TaxID=283909 RepID=R7T944_CAPTE|nr:hypothetical protein CAPTEDRAFT_208586 [Capitella teleta]|eukprot:ELT87920.1 hypothetical protein CAPTEDRAFT_208586 [Capitella teleta]
MAPRRSILKPVLIIKHWRKGGVAQRSKIDLLAALLPLLDQLTRYYRNKKIVVTEWHEQRDAIFDAFLSASWPLACAGDKCSSCQKLSDLFFLCEDCGPQYVECMSCSNASHDMRPLHFRRLWNGHKYIQADGVVVIETQHNSTCTSRILRLMDIYDCKGRHHKVKMRFCNCEKRAATLLKHGLWPARPVSPNAAYHIDFLMLLSALTLDYR